MLEAMRRVLKRGFRAVGFLVIRLPSGNSLLRMSAAGSPRARVGVPPAIDRPGRLRADKPIPHANSFAETEALIDLITPWSGDVPEGFVVDSLGILTDGTFLWNRTGPFGGHHESTSRPSVATWGEGYFELASWLMAARDARDRFVAVSLGAAFGAQLVFAWKALQALNPLPCRLIAVEPVPENCSWIRRHMAVNGIDPDEHCIIQAAVGYDNEPALFPVGAPGSGRTGSTDTNSAHGRETYASLLRGHAYSQHVLENILLYNSTGLAYDLGAGFESEMKFVSAVTIRDVLMPLEGVDLLEVDIQGSEAGVIPPFIDVLNRKVRRAHIGTHGREPHDLLRALFVDAGWEIVFDYAPDTQHMTEGGPLDLHDGILSVRNPVISDQ